MRKTPRERWIALTEKRVRMVLVDLRILAQSGDRKEFYGEDEARKIFSAITKELDVCRGRFSPKPKTREPFSFKPTQEDA